MLVLCLTLDKSVKSTPKSNHKNSKTIRSLILKIFYSPFCLEICLKYVAVILLDKYLLRRVPKVRDQGSQKSKIPAKILWVWGFPYELHVTIFLEVKSRTYGEFSQKGPGHMEFQFRLFCYQTRRRLQAKFQIFPRLWSLRWWNTQILDYPPLYPNFPE